MRASRGEITIEEILQNNNVKFKEEYEFKDLMSPNGRPLRFDFAIFDDDGSIDFLIEFQGKQHYEAVSKFGGITGLYQQQYNDNMKRKYCKANHLTLVEIPYWDEQILSYDYIFKKAGY